MKNLLIAVAFLAAAPLAASADVTKEDIKKLAAAGVGEEVILSFIRSNGPVTRFSADDLIELKQAGASEKILTALAAGVSRPTPSVQRQGSDFPSYTPSPVVYQEPSYQTYYSSYYPASYYSGYWGWPSMYGSYYGSCYPRYSYCAPRVGVGIGISGGWGARGGYCAPRATWSMSVRR